jgi:hypothetical protein
MNIFLSSTCYESGDLRAVLEDHINKMGHTPMLSDRSNFYVDVNSHRHDVCLASVKNADLLILVIEPRYGAPYYKDENISITWAEFREADKNNIPVFTFVRSPIFDERKTWTKNNKSIKPSHCDNSKIFDLIDEIQSSPKGYWIETHFNSVVEIIKRIESVGGYGQLITFKKSDGVEKSTRISKTTDDFIRSMLKKEIDYSNLSKDEVDYCINYLPPRDGKYAGVVLDVMMNTDTKSGLFVHFPFRPAEDDGTSWFCYIHLTPQGLEVLNELEYLKNLINGV